MSYDDWDDCGDYDEPTIFEECIRKARKQHRCYECRGTIFPGHHYREAHGLWYGQWSTYRTCQSCCLLKQEAEDRLGHGFSYVFGDLRFTLKEMGFEDLVPS